MCFCRKYNKKETSKSDVNKTKTEQFVNPKGWKLEPTNKSYTTSYKRIIVLKYGKNWFTTSKDRLQKPYIIQGIQNLNKYHKLWDNNNFATLYELFCNVTDDYPLWELI